MLLDPRETKERNSATDDEHRAGDTPAQHQQPERLRVAIVGGGIVGVILALGLVRQGISVRLYEQAAGFREIGAGIAFSACARRCMSLIDPAITRALARCGAVSVSEIGEGGSGEDGENGRTDGDDDDEDDYLRWVDGYNQSSTLQPGDGAGDTAPQRPLAQIGGAGFRGCRRDQFLLELAKEVPAGVIEFGKRLEAVEDKKAEHEDGRVTLHFADGTSAEADAVGRYAHTVIGCDGVKSRVREHLVGATHEASRPQYTHKVAYRGLVAMDKAVEVLGAWKAHNFHHHVGPGAHLTHYPVANGAALNVVVFLSDPKPWPGTVDSNATSTATSTATNNTMVAQGARADVQAALRDWHPTVRALVGLLPESLAVWALFDLGDFPLPYYHAGRVCVAGDAAHASSPHHGASACLGVEDALCLNVLMGRVRDDTVTVTGQERPRSGSGPGPAAVAAAFEAFDAVRRRRTQWLVNSSRRVCDLYHQAEWGDPTGWVKAGTCFEEIRDRSYKIWHFDVDAMLRRAAVEYDARLLGRRNGAAGPKRDNHGYIL